MLYIIYMLWTAMEHDIVTGKIRTVDELELEYGIVALEIVQKYCVECDIAESVSHHLRRGEDGLLRIHAESPIEILLDDEVDAMFAEYAAREEGGPW